MRLQIKHYFDAAHQLKDSDQLVTKACARLHGHTYAVKVDLEAEVNKQGFVIDFKVIKNIIDRFDHQYINDILFNYNFVDIEPTAENIAKVIANWIEDETRCKIISVAVCEGYKGEDKASWAIYE